MLLMSLPLEWIVMCFCGLCDLHANLNAWVLLQQYRPKCIHEYLMRLSMCGYAAAMLSPYLPVA